MLSNEELEDERRLIESVNLEALYERYFNRVYAFALVRLGGDRAAAEDVTSETFLQALAFLPRFEWRNRPLWPWLCKVAGRLCIKRREKEGRSFQLDERVADSAPCILDDIREAEMRAELYELVERLPDRERSVLVLRFGEDLSLRQVAETMGCSEGAVKQLQRRALRKLRDWMEDSDG